jgi:hypothetical protein
MLAGFGQALDRAAMRSTGDTLSVPVIFLTCAIAGPIGGVLTLYLGGGLLKWTGTWLGGQASARHLRAALAWSSVPSVWALLLWKPELALFGQELFTSETPRIDASPMLSLALLGFFALELTVAIWTIIILLKCIGEAQKFSAWKALGNALLAAAAIVLPLIGLVMIGAGIGRLWR